jgi:TatD DNase family protein
MPIFDSHCHYNLAPLAKQWQHHAATAKNHGVEQSIIIGVDVPTSQTAVEMAATDQGMWAAIGVHPSEWQEHPAQNLDDLLTRLQPLLKNDRVVAIGETGLDYYRLEETGLAIKQLQQRSLIAHLALAAEAKLPIILHVRDKTTPEIPTPGNAYWDTLRILQHHLKSDQQFILHCVSGPEAYLSAAVELGAYCGVAGNITYKNAESLRKLIQLIPANKLLFETDAPFLPPQAFRGKTCEPWMIQKTAEFLAEYRGITLEQVYQTTCELFL